MIGMEETDLLALLADIERRRKSVRADMRRIARFERACVLCVGTASVMVCFSLAWLLVCAAWGAYVR